MKPIIEAKNIGKKYNISKQRGSYVALRDVLANMVKAPFSFFRTKLHDATHKKEAFWALRDIDFSIASGEIVGIIGHNGAGKSTLLKILSQITPPTTGEITIRGRVGSLLEVGTGFHPELTGRENIFLNGAILGMKKKEIARKFNDIVAFAEIGRFIDTPVKYYSSGMYVRLAFSVAAHMEPDILIIDEVLAVGDVEFQKKCIGKMEEITQKEKRTILFVSHNMGAIKSLCKRCILLEGGRIVKMGATNDVIDYYSKTKSGSQTNPILTDDTQRARTIFRSVDVTTTDDSKVIKSEDKLRIAVVYETDLPEAIQDARLVITITSMSSGQAVLVLDSYVTNHVWKGALKANGTITCESDRIDLTEGEYGVTLDFLVNGESIDYVKTAATFDVVGDIEKYGYKNSPDTTTSHRMIKHSFKQN